MMGRVFVALGVFLATLSFGAPAAEKAGKFRNFRVAIYVTRDNVIEWADPQKLALAYNDMCRQVKFDKVYLEIASGKLLVSEATIEPIKKFFTDHGVEVACAIVANGSSGFGGTSSQAGSLSFSDQADRDYLKGVAELAARHCDEVILDDWFFSAAKTSAEIAAKGNRSWTRYRLDTLDDAALNLLIKPAKAINPRMRLIIKFPNWYEHYQGLGYDLEVEPKLFDGIYTGVETRDPAFWDQHLQQYESYDLFRYLENVKPGGNGGGWVDTLLTRYIDRYPEQIWDLAFAKPKEITLWRWRDELASIEIGERPWQNQETSFNLAKMDASFAARTVAAESSQPAVARNGHVAEYAMEQVDSFLGDLGNPIGIDAYRPPHATGEEFYHDFLGMVGVPIDLHFSFPDASTSSVILLTESAKSDPDIVKKIKAQLAAGKTVTITSGLLYALKGRGIDDISEFDCTDQKVGVTDFRVRNGEVIRDAKMDAPILFPIIHLLTNQSWAQVSGFDDRSPEMAYPIVLRDAYDRGFLNVLVLPDNIADLYRLPTPPLNAIRREIVGSFPIRLVDAPAKVSLFAYDNGAFVVQSFLPAATTITVGLAGNPKRITDLVTQQSISAEGVQAEDKSSEAIFTIAIPPHSYRAFRDGR